MCQPYHVVAKRLIQPGAGATHCATEVRLLPLRPPPVLPLLWEVVGPCSREMFKQTELLSFRHAVAARFLSS